MSDTPFDDPQNVTWYIPPEAEAFAPHFDAAFTTWRAEVNHANLNGGRSLDISSARIRVDYLDFSNPYQLASEISRRYILLNSVVYGGWHDDLTQPSMFLVALHEFGHILLSLEHDDDPTSIMHNPATATGLSPNDKARIRALYGAPPAEDSAVAVGNGDWQGFCGADGYWLSQGAQSLPAYATVTLAGQSNHTWQASTSDTRALKKPAIAPDSPDRIAACWFTGINPGPSFTVNVSVTGGPRRVRLYGLDWDNYGPRSQRVDVMDAAGSPLGSVTVNDFQAGRYLAWDVTGSVQFKFTALVGNPVLSGIFFG